jgi:hypothetical protein
MELKYSSTKGVAKTSPSDKGGCSALGIEAPVFIMISSEAGLI